MRRAQTVRHRQSQSVAVTDDLGFLREGDQSIEDVLRQDLAATRRENERLQSQIDSLNAALKSRPPQEKFEQLQREYQNLDLILHGTQKENERAMTELERVKNRERVMEKKLRDLIGEDWEETINIGGTISAMPSGRSFGTPRARAGTAETWAGGSNASATSASTEATLEHMENIRAMLTGMAERLQSGEQKVQDALNQAEEEKKLLKDMLKKEIDTSA
ncbi:hypothetical protein M422DRAFT_154103 [Sphaerobolus stellatus SS14]|nr:hypothetical protein M422DRAFT_154103 [Sphaerobolus stellatus SS14]